MRYPTVEIEGKEYPYLLGRGALRAFARKKGFMETKTKDLDKMMMDATLGDQDLLSWFAFKIASNKEGIKFDYTFEEFQTVLDEHPEIIDAIDEVQEEQMPDTEGKAKAAKS